MADVKQKKIDALVKKKVATKLFDLYEKYTDDETRQILGEAIKQIGTGAIDQLLQWQFKKTQKDPSKYDENIKNPEYLKDFHKLFFIASEIDMDYLVSVCRVSEQISMDDTLHARLQTTFILSFAHLGRVGFEKVVFHAIEKMGFILRGRNEFDESRFWYMPAVCGMYTWEKPEKNQLGALYLLFRVNRERVYDAFLDAVSVKRNWDLHASLEELKKTVSGISELEEFPDAAHSIVTVANEIAREQLSAIDYTVVTLRSDGTDISVPPACIGCLTEENLYLREISGTFSYTSDENYYTVTRTHETRSLQLPVCPDCSAAVSDFLAEIKPQGKVTQITFYNPEYGYRFAKANRFKESISFSSKKDLARTRFKESAEIFEERFDTAGKLRTYLKSKGKDLESVDFFERYTADIKNL